MPVLNGIENKTLFNRQVDKENENVAYNDQSHLYFSKDNGEKYISVTTLIHQYTQPFDGEFWSSYKALEAIMGDNFRTVKSQLLSTKRWNDELLDEFNIDYQQFLDKKQEILDSYEEKKKIACERGVKIHAKLEQSFYDLDTATIGKYAGGGKFECKKGYYKLDLKKAIYPEFLISHKFDDYLKVAGQIDLLIVDGNDIYIKDWKSNAKIDTTSYFDKTTKKKQMMKYPLTTIPDCNFYHYSLQLSLYAYLLQTINPKYNIKKLSIVHFDHDGNETEYECQYLKDDVARLLLHYRKKNKVKLQLAADEPIVF